MPKSHQNGQVIAELVKVASSGSQPTSSIITVQKAQRQVNFLSNFYAREYQLKQELTKTTNAFFARKTLQNLIDRLGKRQEHALCRMTFLDSLNRFVNCNCLAKHANISRRVSKLTFLALALRQSTWTNCGLCVCSNVEDGATLLV